MPAEEELRRRLAARGYAGAALVAVPSGGAATAVYRVAADGGPGPLRLQGTVGELRHRIARLPRWPPPHGGAPAPDHPRGGHGGGPTVPRPGGC